MAISENPLRQFQIPTPSFIANIQSEFVGNFINVATVIAIIGIAASIFAMSPILGGFSALMLGVCLIAKSAREDAAGRQAAETALRDSEAVTNQMQNELATLKNTLEAIKANELSNSVLIDSLNARILEQDAELQSLATSEAKLKQELQEAIRLVGERETTSAQFRNLITQLQEQNKKLSEENTTLKNKPVVTQALKQENRRAMFSFGGSASK